MNRKKLRPKAYHFTLHDTSGYMKVTCHSSVRPHLPSNSPAHHGFHPIRLWKAYFSNSRGHISPPLEDFFGQTFLLLEDTLIHTYPHLEDTLFHSTQ
ncbi:hypothetical protein BgiBS90_030433 [Biomphalaria glabrata]|nr:hypothetical protein BgiBS90_030433 [Biomphalaria glabrata]